jgi:hypothetical protein
MDKDSGQGIAKGITGIKVGGSRSQWEWGIAVDTKVQKTNVQMFL